MPTRAERRQAEHLRRKLAYQQTQHPDNLAAAEPAESTAPAESIAPATPIQPYAKSSISEAQLAANRANAQFSTGASTAEGKLISSHNALKTGLTGRTVLLPTDDEAEYRRRLQCALTHHKPVTEEEQTLVHSVVDIDWRLDRVVTLETGIYSKGLVEFDGKFKDQSPVRRNLLIQTETYLKYEKSLRNLHIQENRLQRQRAKNLAELKRLQEERTRRELALKLAAQRSSLTASTGENGFEFSTLPGAFAPACIGQPQAPEMPVRTASQAV